MHLRKARCADVPALLALINGYAQRNLLLPRTEPSLVARLDDFLVAELKGELVGCGALSPLGPGLGEIRSLAVRADCGGHGLGSRIVRALMDQAQERGFLELLTLTRRVSLFASLGFTVTRRERFLDKLAVDCAACPMNSNCDETALRWEPPGAGAFDDKQARAQTTTPREGVAAR